MHASFSNSRLRSRAKKRLRKLRARYVIEQTPELRDEIRELYRFISGPPKRADRVLS
jgi:hypothetical protein